VVIAPYLLVWIPILALMINRSVAPKDFSHRTATFGPTPVQAYWEQEISRKKEKRKVEGLGPECDRFMCRRLVLRIQLLDWGDDLNSSWALEENSF